MEIPEFFASYPDGISELAEQLRTAVNCAAPGCSETLHEGWRVVSYGYGKKFCAIAPHKNWINLQFHNGAALSDDDGLLQGTGKSMRHVKISAATDIDPRVERLVQQASALAQ